MRFVSASACEYPCNDMLHMSLDNDLLIFFLFLMCLFAIFTCLCYVCNCFINCKNFVTFMLSYM